MLSRRLLAAPLVLLAAVAAGCGAPTSSAGDFEGVDQDVAQTIEDFQAAANEDDAKAICETYLAPSLIGKLGNRCEDTIQAGIDDADTNELIVDSVRVTGTSARAQVFVGIDEERKVTMTLEKAGDDWKITSLGQPS